jgi:hypothetical protein
MLPLNKHISLLPGPHIPCFLYLSTVGVHGVSSVLCQAASRPQSVT